MVSSSRVSSGGGSAADRDVTEPGPISGQAVSEVTHDCRRVANTIRSWSGWTNSRSISGSDRAGQVLN